MGGFLRFLWRAIQSQPVTTIFGALMVMAGISYQEWLIALAKEPPWFLTNHIVQLVIIALGVLIVAFVFYRQSEADRSSKPRPDMDLRKAVDYLRVRSRWAVGRLYSANQNHLLEEDIDGVIRDAAIQGRVSIWGRPRLSGATALVTEPLEMEIPANEWPNFGFSLTTLVHDDAPNGVCTWDIDRSGREFFRLRVNREQIYREWPPASFGRLFFDKTWKSRKEQSV
jgi:hypothetical protein